jgi:hypothetical protein
MKIPVLIAVLLLSTSCKSTLPTESKIGYNPATGLITFSLPKDSHGSLLNFEQNIGSNHISLVLRDFSFTNNPVVLDAVAAGYVGMITAMGGVINGALGAAVAGGKVIVPMSAYTNTSPDGTVTMKK